MDNPALEVMFRQPGPIPLDVDFTCPAGTCTALLGPSGAGKTTILRSIAGLYRPTEATVISRGVVWLSTRDGTDRPAHQRRTGLLFQSFALFPHLTARDNVTMSLLHLPRRARQHAADALLVRVGLGGAGQRHPSSLSGGEQQRVALARALARDPEVLLLDEPFSAVDRPMRRRLQADLLALRNELRIPIILVSHDIDDALLLADRLVVIDSGRMVYRGTIEDVRLGHVPDDVRALLDLSPPDA